jgi:hypothetical protein
MPTETLRLRPKVTRFSRHGEHPAEVTGELNRQWQTQ